MERDEKIKKRIFTAAAAAVTAVLLMFTAACGGNPNSAGDGRSSGGHSSERPQESGEIQSVDTSDTAEQTENVKTAEQTETAKTAEQTETAKAAEEMSYMAVSKEVAAVSDIDLNEENFSGESYSSAVNESLTEAYKETLPGADLDPSSPMVALTFDDGPYSPVTLRLTELLKQYNAHATFFIVGNRAETYQDAIQAEVDAGCELANHTWDHKNNLTKINADQIQWEVNQCNEKLAELTGITPKLLRPVGGAHDAKVDGAVGMPMITWTVDTQDWKSKNAASVISRCMDTVADGTVVLMHDLYPSTADACETIIPQLIEMGYRLVTVSEMAAARGYELEAGMAYNSFYQQ